MARRSTRPAISRSKPDKGFFDSVSKTAVAVGAFGTAAATGTFLLATLQTACVLPNLANGDMKEWPVLGAILIGGPLAAVLWHGQKSNPVLRYATAFVMAVIVFGVVYGSLMSCTCGPPSERKPWFKGMTGRGFEALCLANPLPALSK